MEMVPPGRRKRGRPKESWIDCVNRDMRAIGTTSDEVHDRTGWRRIVSAAATPTTKWERLGEEEEVLEKITIQRLHHINFKEIRLKYIGPTMHGCVK